MLTTRRSALLLAMVAAWPVGRALAADYPTRPIRLIVPYAPGGGADAVARVVARHVGWYVLHAVVVDTSGNQVGTDWQFLASENARN